MNNFATSPTRMLRLSCAELYVLTRLLKAKNIPGIDLTWFQNPPAAPSSEIVLQTVDTAVKALVARGYLIPLQPESSFPQPLTWPEGEGLATSQQDWKKIGIPAEVLGLIETSAFSTQSLSLVWRTARGVRLLWLHAREQLIVAVTSPLPEIYEFLALPNREDSLDMLTEVLGLKEQQAPQPPVVAGKLRVEILAQTREAIHLENPTQALSLLTNGGLPEPTALSFLEATGACTTVANLTITRQPTDPSMRQQQAKLAAVVTPTTCFVLQSMGEFFSVQAVSAADIRTWISQIWSRPDTNLPVSPLQAMQATTSLSEY